MSKESSAWVDREPNNPIVDGVSDPVGCNHASIVKLPDKVLADGNNSWFALELLKEAAPPIVPGAAVAP
jgi:hypothetical protein